MEECKNCIWQQSCKEKKPCSKHTTLNQRICQLGMTLERYEVFCKEWDEARRRVRGKYGIKEK